MDKSTCTWQFISFALAVALIAALIGLHRRSTDYRPVTGALPTVTSTANFEHLVLSPNARRALERYLL
jgi:hypothetical protein